MNLDVLNPGNSGRVQPQILCPSKQSEDVGCLVRLTEKGVRGSVEHITDVCPALILIGCSDEAETEILGYDAQ